jgi:hypothetical protein
MSAPARKMQWRNDKGELHREDGPAIEYISGNKSWYINGKLHRLDGPALILTNGNRWYCNGKLHRLDGPAVTFNNNRYCWYIDGNRVDCNDNDEFLRIVKNLKSLL